MSKTPVAEDSEGAVRRKAAFRFIGLMGLVSFFGDVTYEAVRSISGPYLASLGGGAAVVGFVAGFGQFAGYALRLLSGWYADRTERYWALTIVGYGSLLLLPLLAFAGGWEVAAALLIGERVGKAVRTPARDAIISYAAKDVGRGIGFGFHEFMDKVGSMVGPLLFSGLFLLRGDYRFGFSVLWIPAACCIGVLLWSRSRLALPDRLEADAAPPRAAEATKLSRLFWAYAGFTFLAVAGFASFPLMAYHFKVRSLMGDAAIPLVFAIGMGIDAVAALAIGRIYDRVGLATLSITPAVTVGVALLAFLGGTRMAVASILCWGVVMAVHETLMRAAIGDLTPKGRRGWAYGVFNTIYGAGWFLGSTAMGFLYERFTVASVVWFVVAMEIASLPFLVQVLRRRRSVAA